MAFLRKQNRIYHIIYLENRKQRSFTTHTEKKYIAEGFLKQFEAQHTLRIPFEIYKQTPRIDLSIALDRFQGTKANDSTKAIYGYATRRFMDLFGDKEVSVYNSAMFLDFYTALQKERLSQSTVANYSRHLFILFNYLVREKYIKENPVTLIRPENKEVRPIPLWQLDLICMDLFKRFMFKQLDFVKLTFLCALRVSETINLCSEDFDLTENLIYIRNTKGKRIDKIPMLQDIKNHILQMELEQGKIFDYSHRQSATSFWRKANGRWGFKNTIHSLRKARGSQLANAGVEPFFLQKFMRHRSFQTTNKYYLKSDIQKMRDSINSKLNYEEEF